MSQDFAAKMSHMWVAITLARGPTLDKELGEASAVNFWSRFRPFRHGDQPFSGVGSTVEAGLLGQNSSFPTMVSYNSRASFCSSAVNCTSVLSFLVAMPAATLRASSRAVATGCRGMLAFIDVGFIASGESSVERLRSGSLELGPGGKLAAWSKPVRWFGLGGRCISV